MSAVITKARNFSSILRSLQNDLSNESSPYEVCHLMCCDCCHVVISNHSLHVCFEPQEELQILKVCGDDSIVSSWSSGHRAVFICEKPVIKAEDDEMDKSSCSENEAHELLGNLGPQPVSIMKARQLLSWYTMSQNQKLSHDSGPLDPLWVRCDMSDPAGTSWLGAETVHLANKVTGVKLYSVTCKGPSVERKSSITLEDLKQEHKKRHHPLTVAIKGNALYNLFGSTVVENTTIESQSSVTVEFKWSHVERVLETPPLSSKATLKMKITSGDMRSPMFQMYRELEFLQVCVLFLNNSTNNVDLLAGGLRTGETEWMEPLETQSAVELIKTYLEGMAMDIICFISITIPCNFNKLQRLFRIRQQSQRYAGQQTAEAFYANTAKIEAEKAESETSIFDSFMERGNLDFVEQIWVRMRKSVTSYQDVQDCLKLVMDSLSYGDLKPWIHRDSNSSLGKVFLKSYHQPIDHVSLTGLTPITMLLEIGLDKMRKDYINYLIGNELTTLNHLRYYISTEVDLQEQVIRLRKLHHLLEIMVTCSTFLGLPFDRLFCLTQSCLQYYKTSPYNEDHEFTLQITPALISHLYQKEHPVVWGAEVSSGHGPREVKTTMQLSDKPLVDHIVFDTDYTNGSVDGNSEELAYFTTMVCCSLVNFA
ncbi:Protein zwilch [Merluccius polli]|uniref:Protein zwilch n=1 Tax=Merluccius polli TaxID=89951 RepID=A0AA47MYG2_MERPO|nr:Protein zwilch [Merluccius polli]